MDSTYTYNLWPKREWFYNLDKLNDGSINMDIE